jgi:hypothetical protein
MVKSVRRKVVRATGFSNQQQINLFRFLNESLDLKSQKIYLPESEKIAELF